MEEMPFPSVEVYEKPSFLRDGLAIRFNSLELPYIGEPFFTVIDKHSSLYHKLRIYKEKEEDIITPVISEWALYCCLRRRNENLIPVPEDSIISCLNLDRSECGKTPDIVYYTEMENVDTTYPEDHFLHRHQVVMIEEHKTDATFFEEDSIYQLVDYLFMKIGGQIGRNRMYGLLVSPSFIRIVLLQRHSYNKGNSNMSFVIFVSPFMRIYEGGLEYWYQFLQQDMAFYGLSTTACPPSGVIMYRTMLPILYYNIQIGATGIVYNLFRTRRWIVPDELLKVTDAESYFPPVVKSLRSDYKYDIPKEIVHKLILSVFKSSVFFNDDKKVKIGNSGIFTLKYVGYNNLKDSERRMLPLGVSVLNYEMHMRYLGIPLCDSEIIKEKFYLNHFLPVLSQICRIGMIGMTHKDIDRRNICFFKPYLSDYSTVAKSLNCLIENHRNYYDFLNMSANVDISSKSVEEEDNLMEKPDMIGVKLINQNHEDLDNHDISSSSNDVLHTKNEKENFHSVSFDDKTPLDNSSNMELCYLIDLGALSIVNEYSKLFGTVIFASDNIISHLCLQRFVKNDSCYQQRKGTMLLYKNSDDVESFFKFIICMQSEGLKYKLNQRFEDLNDFEALNRYWGSYGVHEKLTLFGPFYLLSNIDFLLKEVKKSNSSEDSISTEKSESSISSSKVPPNNHSIENIKNFTWSYSSNLPEVFIASGDAVYLYYVFHKESLKGKMGEGKEKKVKKTNILKNIFSCFCCLGKEKLHKSNNTSIEIELDDVKDDQNNDKSVFNSDCGLFTDEETRKIIKSDAIVIRYLFPYPDMLISVLDLYPTIENKFKHSDILLKSDLMKNNKYISGHVELIHLFAYYILGFLRNVGGKDEVLVLSKILSDCLGDDDSNNILEILSLLKKKSKQFGDRWGNFNRWVNTTSPFTDSITNYTWDRVKEYELKIRNKSF